MTGEDDRIDRRTKDPTDVTLVCVGSIILIGLVFTGMVIFLIGTPDPEWSPSIETVNCDIRIYHENDTMELILLSGVAKWSDYDVSVNGTIIHTESTESYAGHIALFRSPIIKFEPGEEYKIRIVDIMDNKVVYNNEIIAR